MALIEQLEGPHWRDALTRTFSTTLEVLETDPFRSTGSSVDDLRGWLRTGGVANARDRLAEQARARRFSAEDAQELIAFFDTLVFGHRAQLLRLAGSGVLPAPSRDRLSARAPTELDVAECLRRLAAGECPFEEWMHATGHGPEDIAAVFAFVDDWLARPRTRRTLH
jgi:hypothetical protein